ncbi:hypothetical protein IGB42_03804 [Andreprevotia sp. IGB-42]|uniref:DUF1800 domain-containing protein n=1 Tax=Andreprevotia sp. IGB-42 TaxID=2497473 RepID=UPI00135BDAAA|nr:DUF1800 domain-containing protein [Andreprevotia sp. IGB-42]KAF0811787.1 hypothetical protein IGB42_03804 [Andreprevotia sp. IGB-42]
MLKLATLFGALFIATSAIAAPLTAPLTDAQRALHALNRLGYGPAPGDVQRVQAMGVERYIDQQLHPEKMALPPVLAQKLTALQRAAPAPGEMLSEFRPPRGSDTLTAEQKQQARREVYQRAAQQVNEMRLLSAVYSPRQLEEVMTDFWFNHFNVYADKGITRVFVADYERSAIRPYALGRFRDLLGATAKHPAMLFYLDNWQSTATGYRVNGKGKVLGLNENYARELMELHTLGVDGGYTQQDVTELARMLTGWTFDPRGDAAGAVAFRYDAARHDNGSKTWLKQAVAPAGQAEGERALDVLAASPVTARHISYQLAQYFVADVPPPALVNQLTQRYLATQGDIRAVLATLFASPAFWDSANVGSKFKTPYQYVVSATRASGAQLNNVRPLVNMLRQLGMPLYGCQTPDGYKNTEAAWLNANAIATRISFATALGSGRMPLARAPELDASAPMSDAEISPVDPAALAATLGPTLSANARTTISAADAALQPSLMLGSPDFQRH